jgi:hypothetical protein
MAFVPRRSPIPVTVDEARIEEIEADRARYVTLWPARCRKMPSQSTWEASWI